MLRAELETHIDYDQTAAIGTRAFDNPKIVFSGNHLKFSYEQSFSCGTTVIALRNDTDKVGQIALVKQSICMNGAQEEAAQLVDLFIDKPFRGRKALTLLYEEVERQFQAQDIRFGFGMPNAKAAGVNEHFFKLKPYLALDVRIGVALPLPPARVGASVRLTDLDRNQFLALANPFNTPTDENGLKWTGETLLNRLGSRKHTYGVHATENMLLISSPRETKGIKHTLLCGFLVRPGTRPGGSELRHVVRAACGLWNHPVFIYAGYYKSLPYLPGISLPKRIHPSPMLLQIRDFHPDRSLFGIDRFQSIDFDFA
jgi:Acetyltransferase (GNAT) domain